jgi:hypothetical protein
MQKAKDRFNQSEKVETKSSEKTPKQLPGANIDFDVASIFYPGIEKFTRRYSIDDNGGGYQGL